MYTSPKGEFFQVVHLNNLFTKYSGLQGFLWSWNSSFSSKGRASAMSQALSRKPVHSSGWSPLQLWGGGAPHSPFQICRVQLGQHGTRLGTQVAESQAGPRLEPSGLALKPLFS